MRLFNRVELFTTKMSARGYDAKTEYRSIGEFAAKISPVSASRYSDDAIQFQERDAVTHRIRIHQCAGATSCMTIRHCERWFRIVNQTEEQNGRAWYSVFNVALVRTGATKEDLEMSAFSNVSG